MRSWFYIGSIALAASTSFAGCTITATTGGDGGSAGADGGAAGSGGKTTGGTSASGGSTSASGGSTSASGGSTQASSQGGSSSSGGTSQGGTSTTGSGASVAALITQYCAIAQVNSCHSSCATEYTDLNTQFNSCESLLIPMLACYCKLDGSAFTCDSQWALTTSCNSEQAAYNTCTGF